MSKKNTARLMNLVADFIEGLTEREFQSLLNNQAKLCVEVLDNNPDQDIFIRLKSQANSLLDIEEALKKFKKNELISLCKIHGIDVKTRDTKKVIYEKVAAHLKVHDSEGTDVSNPYEEVKKILNNSNDREDATEYLVHHPLLKTKKDLIKLAKSYAIYVDQKYTKRDLLDRIVESVVGARLRGKAIRSVINK
ncbi:hypothetical protein HNQ94_001017 [Salirhabdus euzebyi]|uniref:Uncharacterized protein n=1 Tax=Salirhabdus euzebyi TaxID=394506 RepID=A0A841Q287_9BACI|nr:hypothetical protein [Salirhabdus euzebyi]MBB6452572.1 hypothetical protein [Salirhabdus euzebyi]